MLHGNSLAIFFLTSDKGKEACRSQEPGKPPTAQGSVCLSKIGSKQNLLGPLPPGVFKAFLVGSPVPFTQTCGRGSSFGYLTRDSESEQRRVKIKPPGIGPQVLVHVFTYQGNPCWSYPVFAPRPCCFGKFARWTSDRALKLRNVGTEATGESGRSPRIKRLFCMDPLKLVEFVFVFLGVVREIGPF